MLIKLKKVGKLPKDWVIQFYEDRGTSSCGESRRDWTLVGTVSIAVLIRALGNMLHGGSEREYL